MSSHKEEAERLANEADHYADSRNPPNAVGQLAQVHATMYLAEQQHIANLIAALVDTGITNDPSSLGFASYQEFIERIRA